MAPASIDRRATQASDELTPLVQAEQVRLSIEQVRRIPFPHFLMDACLAWTAWNAGLGAFALAWLVVMTVSQVGRTVTWRVPS